METTAPRPHLREALTQLADPESPPAARYRSRFALWDARASVRVKPPRVLDPSEPGRLYFPPELMPVVAHPLVRSRPDEVAERILTQRLHQYLYFTTELEQVAVMPVTMDISRGRSGLHLPPAMREDAFKITTDEAWHAQFSDDLSRQVEARTGFAACLPDRPAFMERLDRIRAELDHDLRGAADLVFSIVSETLISSILSDLPRDKRLPQAVRDLVQDHAEDEGKHHAYFRSLLEFFWQALDGSARGRIGPLVPSLITAFLEPDYLAVADALGDAGFAAAEAQEIIADAHPAEVTTTAIGRAAQATTRYFTEVGALDAPPTYEAFAAAGLLTAH
ncbi:diiron oxygenase [Streptomyces sp. NPDC006544]|uniref:diiron oxygenase n=1 Tax=Streptomyces sp. NPDC006544 TaxID=3154583 RepID=UPI0033BB1F20